MQVEETNYVEAIHSLEIGNEAVDAIELADGRIIAIDGASVTLFEDMQELFDSEDVEDGDYPSLPL